MVILAVLDGAGLLGLLPDDHPLPNALEPADLLLLAYLLLAHHGLPVPLGLFLLLLAAVGDVDDELARVVVGFVHEHEMLGQEPARLEQLPEVGLAEEDGTLRGRLAVGVLAHDREQQLLLPGPLEFEVVDEDQLLSRVLQGRRLHLLLPDPELDAEVLVVDYLLIEGLQSRDDRVHHD